MAGRRRSHRHTLGTHEFAKQPARLVAPLMALSFEGAIDLGGDRKPHLAAENDGIFCRQTVQPDDVAVEKSRRHQRGVEDRRRVAVPDHGQQIFHPSLPALA